MVRAKRGLAQKDLALNDNAEETRMRPISRRATLAFGCAIGAGSAALSVMGWSRSAYATAKDAADEIVKFTGGKAAEPGKVTIEMPEIAENGNTVPLSVAVDAPMTADNYVSEILVVAEGNPRPSVALFAFSPMSGKAQVSTRMRLAATQNVVVVAKTSTGQFLTGQKLVKVTIGGCGG
jgi:sulfur-oxidizing protein SoxY